MKFNIFDLGIFSINSYVYYLTRGSIASTRAFDLLNRTFNLPTRAFSLLTRGFELITRRFELVICEFKLVTRGFELVTGGFEAVDLVTFIGEILNGKLYIVKENMSNGISPLTDKTLKILKQKHPEANKPPQEVLLQGPIQPVHPIVFEDMDESLILKAAMLTKGGSGPFGLEADGWRKILTSRSFGTASSKLRKTFLLFVKRLCLEEIRNAFLAFRLIPLDKRSGLRPIVVGEVLRRIAGKVVIILLKRDVLQASSNTI